METPSIGNFPDLGLIRKCANEAVPSTVRAPWRVQPELRPRGGWPIPSIAALVAGAATSRNLAILASGSSLAVMPFAVRFSSAENRFDRPWNFGNVVNRIDIDRADIQYCHERLPRSAKAHAGFGGEHTDLRRIEENRQVLA